MSPEDRTRYCGRAGRPQWGCQYRRSYGCYHRARRTTVPTTATRPNKCLPGEFSLGCECRFARKKCCKQQPIHVAQDIEYEHGVAARQAIETRRDRNAHRRQREADDAAHCAPPLIDARLGVDSFGLSEGGGFRPDRDGAGLWSCRERGRGVASTTGPSAGHRSRGSRTGERPGRCGIGMPQCRRSCACG
jgi:hypothetical protein